MSFSVPIKLPSGKTIRVQELNNEQYFVLLKYCENTDLYGLNQYLEELFFKGLTLDIFDRFYYILYVRMMFVSPSIFFQHNGISLEYKINNILSKIELRYDDMTAVIEDQGFKIKLGLPESLYFEDLDSIYNSSIKTITFKSITVDYQQLTQDEKEQVLSKLPLSIFNKVRDYINHVASCLHNVTLIEEIEEFNISTYNINIISNGLMGFICTLFKNSLASFYNTLYMFFNKLNGTPDLYFKLSPLEIKILFNIHNAEIERQNTELKKQH